MLIPKTFTAYDDSGNKYMINVNQRRYENLDGKTGYIRDYSIANTGEVLEQQPENPKIFRIKSTNTLIVDIQ
jgi:hypothetical protein